MNKCKCGSIKFVTNITLEIIEVPVVCLSSGAIEYDDTKGNSQGWDTLEQPEIICKGCGHIYHLEEKGKDTSDGRPTYKLIDMQKKGVSHGR
jgi:hypothetical protein